MIAFIGAYSCLLGVALLIAPRAFLRLTGFPEPNAIFFPSQAGIFLLVLGICYLLALAEPALVTVILISKGAAVIFLVVHAAVLGAPPIVWAAAAGDGAMLAALLAALRRPPQ